jgi:hypothetical protein
VHQSDFRYALLILGKTDGCYRLDFGDGFLSTHHQDDKSQLQALQAASTSGVVSGSLVWMVSS